ncbi:MAG: hypothetical protein L3J52_08605, partial [Proteobacteria bacterium]|nr:hypothetical protein [Pseudomonadota bacterium]
DKRVFHHVLGGSIVRHDDEVLKRYLKSENRHSPLTLHPGLNTKLTFSQQKNNKKIIQWLALINVRTIQSMRIKITVLIMLLTPIVVNAVNLNRDGLGQAIILPYYTVNNGLLTLVSITNTTDKAKAVKFHLREGRNGYSVLSFNLYLAPHDMWTFGLMQAVSDQEGHQGEPSGRIVFTDRSCVVGLVSGQQYSADEYDSETVFNTMQRARDGMIEIFEMGELDASFGYGNDASFDGGTEPNNCENLVNNWAEDGVWNSSDAESQLLPATGGLMAATSILNVQEGLDFTYNGTAIEHFYDDGTIFHTSPDDSISPSLADSETTSLVINKDKVVKTQWPNGYEAISALLMKTTITAEYALDKSINAKAEFLISFPTKRFYVNSPTFIKMKPFTSIYKQDEGSCEEYERMIYDRESDVLSFCELNPYGQGCGSGGGIGVSRPAPPVIPFLCWVTNNIMFSENLPALTPILGANNFDLVNVEKQGEFDHGKYNIIFDQTTNTGSDPETGQTHIYKGLPVLGILFQSYSNTNAQPGLLAQYGGIFPFNHDTDISFEAETKKEEL